MSKLTAMREGGKIHGSVRRKLYEYLKVGTTPRELEALARRLISQAGAEPSFPKVPRYHWATCINRNAGTVHGIPESDEPFQSGDLVTVDLGVYYRHYHSDGAFTKLVGRPSKEKTAFLSAGLAALSAALQNARPGRRVGHLSQAVQTTLARHHCIAFRELTGHGVGRELHENPMIPNLLEGKISATPQLVLGQTIAIEVIYTAGKPELVLEEDGWTISTKDGKLSAVFEETVEITDDGSSILTQPTLFELTRPGKI